MYMELKEAKLFPPLKKYFKEQGYKVFAEVPCFYRGVDFVAVKGNEHIAVEMKTSFSKKVISQAHDNRISFSQSYVAFPVKKPFIVHIDEHYWKLKESTRVKINLCQARGIGIIEILPDNTLFFALESVNKKPYRVFDFSQFKESDDDEAGLPCQKGVSAGYYELEAIKEYVRAHPKARWPEIYAAVQNHYSSPSSLSGSMSHWRGFHLAEFKKFLPPNPLAGKPE